MKEKTDDEINIVPILAIILLMILVLYAWWYLTGNYFIGLFIAIFSGVFFAGLIEIYGGL